jgi:protein-tyrosine-phosphatase
MNSDPTQRDAALQNADTVVFLCSGNMVRSAFADLYARHLGCPLPVRSAATVYYNEGIFPDTARALLARGVAREAVAAFRPVHIEDLVPSLRGAAVFLAMRHHHIEAVEPWPEHHARSFLLDAPHEIADPVLEGADFDETFARVARCVEKVVERLARPQG